MFDPSSRYATTPQLRLTDETGREVAFVARRFIPENPRVVAQLVVAPGDRLDLVAHRAYGDARAFWRVCDANPAPDPLALASDPDRRLHLSQPGEVS
jgi:hypothetical protein